MRWWLATLGGIGHLPAGGTFASLATAGLLAAAWFVTAPSPAGWAGLLLGVVAASSAGTVLLGPWAEARFGRKDARPFVLDEAAGVALSLLWLPMDTSAGVLGAVAAGFVLFRVFDIWKPPPARWLERLPAGWGVLLDDLLAGVYANIVGQALLRWIL
mgnify:CR=1 FL=1